MKRHVSICTNLCIRLNPQAKILYIRQFTTCALAYIEGSMRVYTCVNCAANHSSVRASDGEAMTSSLDCVKLWEAWTRDIRSIWLFKIDHMMFEA
jgi:hypothetical protein